MTILRSQVKLLPVREGRAMLSKHSNYKGNQEYGMPIAGKNGYIQVYNRKTLKKEMLHRVIWETLMGEIPKGLTIDHINGKRNDNRIENLQLLTHKANCQRQMKGSASFRKDLGKWCARRGQKHYGFFYTKCGALMASRTKHLSLSKRL